jgi:hypothetical protein
LTTAGSRGWCGSDLVCLVHGDVFAPGRARRRERHDSAEASWAVVKGAIAKKFIVVLRRDPLQNALTHNGLNQSCSLLGRGYIERRACDWQDGARGKSTSVAHITLFYFSSTANTAGKYRAQISLYIVLTENPYLYSGERELGCIIQESARFTRVSTWPRDLRPKYFVHSLTLHRAIWPEE